MYTPCPPTTRARAAASPPQPAARRPSSTSGMKLRGAGSDSSLQGYSVTAWDNEILSSTGLCKTLPLNTQGSVDIYCRAIAHQLWHC